MAAEYAWLLIDAEARYERTAWQAPVLSPVAFCSMPLDSDIEVFVTVVDRSSFRQAAKDLDLSRSAISKRISRLEDRLGVRLLNRSSRSISLTPAGQVYYLHSKRALTHLCDAHRAIGELKDEPMGVLRVTCAIMIGLNVIIPALPSFYEKNPKVRLELHLSDRFEDLVTAGFEVAVRMGTMRDSSLVARRIMSAKRVICAAPSYLQRNGEPRVPQDLLEHNCLNLLAQGTNSNVWNFLQNGRLQHIEVTGNFATNDGAGHYHALLVGVGIGRVTDLRALTDFQEGRLVRLLESFEPAEASPIYAVMPSNQNISPAARAFIDFFASYRLEADR